MLGLETLQTSIDDIASAVALGMTVGAPAGTTVYTSFAEDSDEADVVYVRGYHATRESALAELLTFAFDVWDVDEPELAPWWDENAPEEDYKSHVQQARSAWIASNTEEEILDEFFGKDWWGVNELKIEKAHKRPF